MTLKECYAITESDWIGVTKRLQSEERVLKFALRFVSDQNFMMLCRAIESGDTEDAFRASHTLKGICQNLGFDKLYSSASALTESLRSGKISEVSVLFEQVKNDYSLLIDSLAKLDL